MSISNPSNRILPPSFYIRADVVQIARELLGMVLVTCIDGILTAGLITETEAYAGAIDKASHAYGNRRTARTEPMFSKGGISYVYLCYGLHHLFNIVTGPEHIPHAVLIRAISPLDGLEDVLLRRNKTILTPTLSSGPGSMSAAMGIKRNHTAMSLQGPLLWIEDRSLQPEDADIISGTRVGVAYAAEDALLPFRFWIKGNAFVSKAKGL